MNEKFLISNTSKIAKRVGVKANLTFSPIVSGSRLTEDEIVGAENLAERTRSDRVHRSRLQINQASARHIFSAWGT